jgi:predicted aspartyl protease
MRQILCLIAGCVFAAVAHAGCQVEPRGTVPIEAPDGNLLVTVQVNDAPATFVLDTGAQRTLMGEDVVRRLGLERDSWVASAVRGLGGIEQRPNALPRSLRLGSVVLRRRTLLGDNSVTVGPLPVDTIAGRAIAGLLGRDFLSPFDLDLDLPRRRLTLYEVEGCEALLVPWTVPYAAIPLTMPMDAALVAQVVVDGRPLRALIDTGASVSLITAPGMARLGLTEESLARDPGGTTRGIGPAAVPVHLHRFGELRVGPEVTSGLALWVAPVRNVVPVVDMLLGADWLMPRHVWLSFATRRMFVAQAGG